MSGSLTVLGGGNTAFAVAANLTLAGADPSAALALLALHALGLDPGIGVTFECLRSKSARNELALCLARASVVCVDRRCLQDRHPSYTQVMMNKLGCRNCWRYQLRCRHLLA